MDKCCDTCGVIKSECLFCGSEEGYRIPGIYYHNKLNKEKDYCSRWEQKEVSEVGKLTAIIKDAFTQLQYGKGIGEDINKQLTRIILKNYVSKYNLELFIKGRRQSVHTTTLEDIHRFIEEQTNGNSKWQ